MLERLLSNLEKDIANIIKDLGVNESLEIFFEIPKDQNFGDYSTNIAMRLAKHLKKNPRMIAEAIKEKIDLNTHHLEKCEVAGSGFINFFFDRNYLAQVVFQINKEKESYGNLKLGNEKINVEFVSANPTGYLHIGHGRGAAYGDSLVKVLRKAGFEVTAEHYVNDAGNQIHNLANSIYERYKELFGYEINLGPDAYHGEEIITIAEKIKEEHGDYFLNNDWYSYFRKFGIDYLLNGLKKDLSDYNVTFDIWFSEKSLYDNNEVQNTLAYLQNNGYTYEEDGAVWLKTSEFGDDKDRVLVKSNGDLTYITPDIAYHANKFKRGYDILIDVLGGDHHGYINRLRAALACLGYDPNKIEIEILQMVRIIKDGEELKLSKRSGKAITLRDLIDEIGSDALRYLYVSKSLSTHMDIDLDLAIKESNENPVYYIQYAYARICSLFRTLQDKGLTFTEVNNFSKLNIEKLEQIIKLLLQYPAVIKEAALKRIPHKIAQFIYDLAGAFHSYYNDEKIITDDETETNEKLTVLKAVQYVLKDSFNLIGVKPKEIM
ncbi:MAG TPA: arginine--tRNA ligase [Acholeplasmataceae bacterium]|nr:arginine--tRNA ligase [Acholeplasmataceae bacterium]